MKKMFVFMCAVFLLTGCYDKTETEDRRYAVIMGIDGGEAGKKLSEKLNITGREGKYILSIGEAKLESDIGNDSEEQKTTAVIGDTIPQMCYDADKYSDKEIYFGQLKAAVLGRDIIIDREKLAETVYNIERMEGINTKVVVFASDGAAALNIENVMNNDTRGGLYLWDYYRNNGYDSDMNEYTDFEGLIKSLRENDTFIIPVIREENGETVLRGGVVIKDGEYAGDITDDDMTGVKWLEGEAKGETVTFDGVTAVVKKETIDIYEQEGLKIIEIYAECTLESGYGKSTEYYAEELETVIKSNIENTINKAQKLDADFTGVLYGDKKVIISPDIRIISTGVIK